MTISDLEHFKNLLIERRENLNQFLESSERVNDGDRERAQTLLQQIRHALEDIDHNEYGVCKVCHGEIEIHRLEMQPVADVCLECISVEDRAELENELFLASKIHRALLPQTITRIDGHEVAVRSYAARYVGGDYYDFLPAGRHDLARIVIADVMGKGMPASLLMSNVQGAIRILAEDIDSPARLVARLNRWLCRNVPITKFVSLACVAIEPMTGHRARLVQANAGHCPPIIVRKNGTIERMEPTGAVLGVQEGFEYGECAHELASEDLVLLYTDGIVEAMNPSGEQFGEERLISIARACHSGPLEPMLDEVVNAVKKFGGQPELTDDCTIIALRKTG